MRITVADPATSPVADLFQRAFTAGEPGRKYMGDITYLPLAGEEFLYLATMLDCFSRKVVGWSIADHMHTGLVADALQMAALTRGGLDGAMFHTDHGAQNGSRAFAGLCDRLGVTRSMGAVGTSADNAACKSFPRVPETRDPPGRPRLRRRRHPPQDCLRLADPLQHSPPTLRQRPPQHSCEPSTGRGVVIPCTAHVSAFEPESIIFSGAVRGKLLSGRGSHDDHGHPGDRPEGREPGIEKDAQQCDPVTPRADMSPPR
ncbi:transposase [Streptomyces bobili]|uniref:transposase n=1 Tax=Streptomyces bobili TaxID=67280 RepID=UPI003654E0BA